jgi:putative ABC transport system substrate-binding protein
MTEQSKIQNRKWLGCIAIFVVLTGWVCVAQAQQPARLPRVGILFMGGRDQPHLESFKQGLREHGYSEGKNIVLEYRYAEGKYDRLTALTQEFVREKVDIIVTTSTQSALAARAATRTIPIVITSGNPVQQGLAESFAKPGGNVTGLSIFLTDLSGKRVELLKEAFPKITRVATLWSPGSSEAGIGRKEAEQAAQALAIRLHLVKVQTRDDIEKAFAALPKANVNALLVVLSPQVTSLENHRRFRIETASSGYVPDAPVRRGRRADGLRSADRRPLSPSRSIRRQNSQRRESCGTTRRAANQV